MLVGDNEKPNSVSLTKQINILITVIYNTRSNLNILTQILTLQVQF